MVAEVGPIGTGGVLPGPLHEVSVDLIRLQMGRRLFAQLVTTGAAEVTGIWILFGSTDCVLDMLSISVDVLGVYLHNDFPYLLLFLGGYML